jgi:CMP-N,N'-diacetyllegionaminic acid synthase
MYSGKKTLAIIPARGGSKGLPGKNIKNLCGKPLLAWTIDQALKSDAIDKVIVTSDSEEIIECAKNFGAEAPFKRPEHLSTDAAPSIDAIEHAINFLNEEYDVVALLEPTSPLRNEEDLDNALRSLIDNWDDYDTVISAGKVTLEHPAICKKLENKTLVPFINDESTVTRRQELSDAYFPYGVIYASKTKSLLEKRTFYQNRILPFTIDRWQNYEIDDICDFVCVEAIMKKYILGKH